MIVKLGNGARRLETGSLCAALLPTNHETCARSHSLLPSMRSQQYQQPLKSVFQFSPSDNDTVHPALHTPVLDHLCERAFNGAICIFTLADVCVQLLKFSQFLGPTSTFPETTLVYACVLLCSKKRETNPSLTDFRQNSVLRGFVREAQKTVRHRLTCDLSENTKT